MDAKLQCLGVVSKDVTSSAKLMLIPRFIRPCMNSGWIVSTKGEKHPFVSEAERAYSTLWIRYVFVADVLQEVKRILGGLLVLLLLLHPYLCLGEEEIAAALRARALLDRRS